MSEEPRERQSPRSQVRLCPGLQEKSKLPAVLEKALQETSTETAEFKEANTVLRMGPSSLAS